MLKRTLFCLLVIMMSVATAVAADKKFVLVVDAGHGGFDAGAIGAISKEKNLTLKFALAFGKMVEQNCPDVRVIYTRKTDVFVELDKRAGIANRNKADLFISIHINALPKKSRKVSGFQTYTLGNGSGSGFSTNLEVAKRENSVIFLEKDYKQRYQGYDPNSPESNIMFEFMQDKNMENSVDLAKLMQQNVCAATGLPDQGAHQANLAVLRLSSMPGCLLELGFISTPSDEKYMNSAAATEQYARGIFNAFIAYKKKFSTGVITPYQAAPQPQPTVPTIVPKQPQPEVKQEPVPEPTLEPKAESVLEQKQDLKAEQKADTATVAVSQPAVEPVPQKETVRPASPAVPEGPVFKVQLVASSRNLLPNSQQFKGVKNVECYRENNLYKYTVGASADYDEILALRKTLSEKFPQAFIVAFRGSQRMDINEAIREYQHSKKKNK